MQRQRAQRNLTWTHAIYFEVSMLFSWSERFGSHKACVSLWLCPLLGGKGQNTLKIASQAIFRAHPSVWVSSRLC